jgi:RNA polymerase sigma-70 factor (ECF subfamily)
MLMAIDRRVDLEKLVRTHQRGVWRYLRYIGAANAEADDLTQETFLTVWRNPFDDYDDRATAAYLRQVAKNKFLMLIRSQSRRPLVGDMQLAENEFAEFAQDDGGDAHIEALGDCLKGLQGKAKQVVEFFHLEGNTRAATATLMQMTEEGVKSLLKRVKEALRECVERKLR